MTKEELHRNYVCEKHFLDSDFKTAKKRYLKNNCFPIPFNNNEFSLKVLTPTKTYSRKRSAGPDEEGMVEIDFNQLPTPTMTVTSSPSTPKRKKVNFEEHFKVKTMSSDPDTPKKKTVKKTNQFSKRKACFI